MWRFRLPKKIDEDEIIFILLWQLERSRRWYKEDILSLPKNLHKYFVEVEEENET